MRREQILLYMARDVAESIGLQHMLERCIYVYIFYCGYTKLQGAMKCWKVIKWCFEII